MSNGKHSIVIKGEYGRTDQGAGNSKYSEYSGSRNKSGKIVGDVNSVHQLGKNCLSGLKYSVKSLRIW